MTNTTAWAIEAEALRAENEKLRAENARLQECVELGRIAIQACEAYVEDSYHRRDAIKDFDAARAALDGKEGGT